MPFDRCVFSERAKIDLRRLGYQVEQAVRKRVEEIRASADFRQVTIEHEDGRSGIRCFDVTVNVRIVRVGFNVPATRDMVYVTSVTQIESRRDPYQLRFFAHSVGTTPIIADFVDRVMDSGLEAFSSVVQVVVMMLRERLTPKIAEKLKGHKGLFALRPEWAGTEYRLHYYRTRVNEQQVFILLNGYVKKSSGDQSRAINQAITLLKKVRDDIEGYSVEMSMVDTEPLRSFRRAVMKSLDAA